ncbi:damage-inducible protein [Asticcacaulis sp. 201]|uniref:ImuA family protein n=1 Tax=Asticcacaulis sp. 201 TaxID=3028787 RepID=UPI002916EF6B|nr:damage-inducible protein [Asticcacaulis sp. 201]MDV6332313.1 damage-inducible protein [Asticcacaulis sp. 201]
MLKPVPSDLAHLRQHIATLDGSLHASGALPFGVDAIDRHLPGGGLALGAVHEIAGRDGGGVDAAAAALFAAGIAARTHGQILWCVTQSDLFAPGLAQVGLTPDRVIYVEARDEKSVLACCEEGLRHGGVTAVVGEVAKLSMMVSRRLQLAAEAFGTLGLIVRRWKQERGAADYGQPTAATTRWRISATPSAPLPVAGIGRARWHLELLRCKGGHSAEFDVEACDGKTCLALAAPLVHRPAQASDAQLRAAS